MMYITILKGDSFLLTGKRKQLVLISEKAHLIIVDEMLLVDCFYSGVTLHAVAVCPVFSFQVIFAKRELLCYSRYCGSKFHL